MFFFFFQAEDGIRDIGVTGVQTCALPISEAHADHIVTPCIHGKVHIRILFAVTHHVVKAPAEVTVARSADCFNQTKGGGVAVATYMKSAMIESVVALEHRMWCDDPLGHVGKGLCRLESGARRVLPHDASVEQWLPYIS